MTYLILHKISKVLTLILFSILILVMVLLNFPESENFYGDYDVTVTLISIIIFWFLLYPIIYYQDILEQYKNKQMSRLYFVLLMTIGIISTLIISIFSIMATFGLGLLFIIPYIILLIKENIKHSTLESLPSANFLNKIKAVKSSKIPQIQNTSELVLVSLIVGLFIGVILGYVLGETQYFHRQGARLAEVHKEQAYLTEFKFNYLAFFVGSIISGGILYLFLSNNTKKE